MALMEVNSPSGFVIDHEHLTELTKIHDLQRVEMEQGDQKANIYFNSVIIIHSFCNKHPKP